MICTTTVLLWQ